MCNSNNAYYLCEVIKICIFCFCVLSVVFLVQGKKLFKKNIVTELYWLWLTKFKKEHNFHLKFNLKTQQINKNVIS